MQRTLLVIIIGLTHISALRHMHAKPHILVIDPAEHDTYFLEQPHRKAQYDVTYYPIEDPNADDACNSCNAIARDIIAKYGSSIDGVITTKDYVGTLVAAEVASQLDLPAPPPKSVITAQHKYYARCAGHTCVPEATPRCMLINPYDIAGSIASDQFPCFVKPVKSYFSFGANYMPSRGNLERNALNMLPNTAFLAPYNQILNQYGYTCGAEYFIAEDILEGQQITLEGFTYHGTTTILGVTDALMYPDTIAFRGFVYPTRLPRTVQQRMEDIARRIMTHLGFDNGFFNIEFTYDAKRDQIAIIEINPRSSPQFADLYEKVDGINSYDLMLAIATNQELPHYRRGSGTYNAAASFALRTFQDQYVEASPTDRHIRAVTKRFPDAQITVHGQSGTYLSDTLQDGNSYLYALINIGGKSYRHLMRKMYRCKEMLPFRFTQA